MLEGSQKKTQNSQFISKLVDMLKCHPSVISWNQQGTQFIVSDKEQMQRTVLPIYFRHSNLSSFIRQLNMYDFHKIEGGADQFRFQHDLFLRGNQSNFHFIQRKRKNKFLEGNQDDYNTKYKNILNAINKNSKLDSQIKAFFNHFIEFKFSMTKNLQNIKDDLNKILNKIKESRTKKLQNFSEEFIKQNQRISELINKSKLIDKSLDGDFSIDVSNYQKSWQLEKKGMNQVQDLRLNDLRPSELNMINSQSKYVYHHPLQYYLPSFSLHSSFGDHLYLSQNNSFDYNFLSFQFGNNSQLNNGGRIFSNSQSQYNSYGSKQMTQKPTYHGYFKSKNHEDSQNSLEEANEQKIQQNYQQEINITQRKILKKEQENDDFK